MEAEIKKQQVIHAGQLHKVEYVLGIIGIISVLVLGNILLKTDLLFFRLLIGTGLGYTLTRAYTGFAGSINRAYTTGSTKLLRAMMFMFFMTALATTTFLFLSDPANYDLWINPINFGVIAGGLLFGFGMAFSSCCASGVLTDLATGFPRAFITLLFFGFGIFIGFPIQHTATWVTNSWVTSSTGNQLQGGVFLPDLFKWDGLGGYLGAVLLTALFCGITVYFAYRYERKRKEHHSYHGYLTERIQDLPDTFESKDYKLFSYETYRRIFIKPWTLKQGAIVISILFVLLMGVTKAGWGASTPFGIWFGKLLMFLGVSPEAIASFTKMSTEPFVMPFFEHPVSVQNFGILVGTVIYLLTAGKMKTMFLQGAHIRKREIALFALGGLSMGLGTRLSNGCNVGALFTPIANFSLSGWIFFLFLALGGIIGNMVAKRVF
ncbi:YeeE/YedE family protein [Virgibacillus proomii]|uniref:YeeE/YedE family protein n=1 Tax=Virgibacillus proomii TaxID=84407 RepID=UPI001C4E038A|nr:YeeE/YedE family protein [Virgibacillus proomii]